MCTKTVYDRKFIRTTRGIIPMILVSTDQATSLSYDKRGVPHVKLKRNWQHCIPSTLAIRDWPEDILLEEFQSVGIKSENELFRTKSEPLEGDRLDRWFAIGLQHACSLEDLLLLNRDITLHARLQIASDDENGSTEEMFRAITTTEELEEWLDKANLRRKKLLIKTGSNTQIDISLSFSENKVLTAYPAGIEPGDAIVITRTRCGYVETYEKNKKLSFTKDPNKAATFTSVQEAQNAIGLNWQNVRFIKKPSGKSWNRNFILKVAEGERQGWFIERCNYGSTLFTRNQANAKGCLSMREARAKATYIFRKIPENVIGSIEIANRKKPALSVMITRDAG